MDNSGGQTNGPKFSGDEPSIIDRLLYRWYETSAGAKWGVAIVVTIAILIGIGVAAESSEEPTNEESTKKATYEPPTLSKTDKRLIDKRVAGLTRLGIEYGVEIDGAALRQVYEACELKAEFLDLSGLDLIIFWTVDILFKSDAEYADDIRQQFISNRLSPTEGLEQIAGASASYEAGLPILCPGLPGERPTIQRDAP